MTEPNVEANYDNVALLLAGVVSFMTDYDSNRIPISYFEKDYSSQQVSVVFDDRANEFVFNLADTGDSDES